MTFCDPTIYNDNPLWSDFVSNSTFYRFLSGFHRTFATGLAYRQGTLTPPDTWSRPFGTCICFTRWNQSFSRTCHYFYGLCSSNIPRYFLDFAFIYESITLDKCHAFHLYGSRQVVRKFGRWSKEKFKTTIFVSSLIPTRNLSHRLCSLRPLVHTDYYNTSRVWKFNLAWAHCCLYCIHKEKRHGFTNQHRHTAFHSLTQSRTNGFITISTPTLMWADDNKENFVALSGSKKNCSLK